MLRTIIFALLFCGTAFAQCGIQVYNPFTNKFNCAGVGLPTGGTTGQLLSKKTNTNYDYQWITASGTGTVTSVGLAGTANQITISGASPVTASGSWTISLPSGLIFPGNVTFAAGGTGAPSYNVPSGVSPTSPTSGDFWNLSGVLQFYNGTTTKSLAFLDSTMTGTWNGTVITAVKGGTGVANTATLTLGSSNVNLASLGTGIVKNTTTTGALSIAVSGTDYAPPTSGTAILKGNNAGGFTNASAGTDYAPATSGSAPLKGNGSGGFSTAAAADIYNLFTGTHDGTHCTAGDGTMASCGGGGSGIVSLSTGTGNPVSACTAPSSSALQKYYDTAAKTLWTCIDTNTWVQDLNTTGTGAFVTTGQTGSAPTAPASGLLTCWFDSTANSQQCIDSSSNVTTMVAPNTGAAHNFLTAISATGAVSRAQPAVSDLSDGANVVKTNQTNTYSTGQKQVFQPSATTAGLNVAAGTLPSSPATGDVAIDSGASNAFKWYNGTGWQTVAGGSGCVPAGGAGDLLTDSGSGGCTSSTDWILTSHTFAGGLNAILDLSAMPYGNFLLPHSTGNGVTTNYTVYFAGSGTPALSWGNGSSALHAAAAGSAANLATTCTNQVITSVSSVTTPTCSTVKSTMVDSSIAATGGDINISSQVVGGSHITNNSITNNGLANSATTVNGQTCTLGSTCTVSGASNTQTTSYTLVAGDLGKVVIMNCSAACTVTMYGTPTNGFYGQVISIGSTVATVSLNSKNYNGSASAPTLNSFRPLSFWSDGTNYFGDAPIAAGSNITVTPSATGFTVAMSATPTSLTSINGISIPTSSGSATFAQTIASGTAALGTTAIASGACATIVTSSASGVQTTDAIAWTPNADITGVTGYAPSTSGGLAIYPYPTANNVNFKVCNPTSGSITPGAVTLNWRVAR